MSATRRFNTSPRFQKARTKASKNVPNPKARPTAANFHPEGYSLPSSVAWSEEALLLEAAATWLSDESGNFSVALMFVRKKRFRSKRAIWSQSRGFSMETSGASLTSMGQCSKEHGGMRRQDRCARSKSDGRAHQSRFGSLHVWRLLFAIGQLPHWELNRCPSTQDCSPSVSPQISYWVATMIAP